MAKKRMRCSGFSPSGLLIPLVCYAGASSYERTASGPSGQFGFALLAVCRSLLAEPGGFVRIGPALNRRFTRQATGVIGGVRRRLLWILVGAIALSNWLPILVDQTGSGATRSVSVAAAISAIPTIGNQLPQGDATSLFTDTNKNQLWAVSPTAKPASNDEVSLNDPNAQLIFNVAWGIPTAAGSSDTAVTLQVTVQVLEKNTQNKTSLNSAAICYINYRLDHYSIVNVDQSGGIGTSSEVSTGKNTSGQVTVDPANIVNPSGQDIVPITDRIRTVYTPTNDPIRCPTSKPNVVNEPTGTASNFSVDSTLVANLAVFIDQQKQTIRAATASESKLANDSKPTIDVAGVKADLPGKTGTTVPVFIPVRSGSHRPDTPPYLYVKYKLASESGYAWAAQPATTDPSKMTYTLSLNLGANYNVYGIAHFTKNGNTDVPGDVVNVHVGADGTVTAAQTTNTPTVQQSGAAPEATGGCTDTYNPYSWSNKPFLYIACGIWIGLVTTIKASYDTLLGPLLIKIVNNLQLAPHLTKQAQFNPSGKDNWPAQIYAIALNVVNYVIILVLLFLSFTNILHINIDTYGIKKVVPTLVYGVILANFSLLITRLVADVADVLLVSFSNPGPIIETLSTTVTQAVVIVGSVGLGAGLATGGSLLPLAIAALIIIWLVPFLLLVVLWLLFLVRYYVVLLLAALSPLAFIAIALPMTQSYFKSWWDNLIKWTFMAPIAFFFLYLATVIRPGGFAGWAITCALMYAAIQVPFSLGGTIMSTWGGALKKVGAWGARTGDKLLGDVTKAKAGGRPMNFQGLYLGWKERNEEREQEQLGEAKAFGRAGSEAWSRGIGAFIAGKPGQISEAYEMEMSRSQNLVVQNNRKKAEEAYSAFEGQKEDATLMTELKSAIGSDYEAAKTYIMVAARRGILDQQTLDQFMESYKGSNTADVAAINSLIPELNRKAEAPNHILASTYHMKGGKLERKSQDQIEDDKDKELEKFSSTHGRSAVQTYVRKTMIDNQLMDEHGRPTDLAKLTADQRAIFNRLRKLNVYNMDEQSKTILTHVNPEVRIDRTEFGADREVGGLVQSAMNAHGIVEPDEQRARQMAAKLRTNASTIQSVLNQHKLKLHAQLPTAVYERGRRDPKIQSMEQWREALSPEELKSIETDDVARSAWAQLHTLEEGAKRLHAAALKAEQGASIDSSHFEHLSNIMGAQPIVQAPRPPTPPPKGGAAPAPSPIINPATGQPFTSTP